MAKEKRPQLREAHLHNVASRLVNSANDREAAILAGAFVEALLYDYAKSHLVDAPLQRVEDLLQYPRPLGSFAGMASILFAFGMLSEREFRYIKIIKDIRNFCAHSLALEEPNDACFNTPTIQKLLKQFEVQPMDRYGSAEDLAREQAKYRDWVQRAPRSALQTIFITTVILIICRMKTAAKLRALTDRDYNSDLEDVLAGLTRPVD